MAKKPKPAKPVELNEVSIQEFGQYKLSIEGYKEEEQKYVVKAIIAKDKLHYLCTLTESGVDSYRGPGINADWAKRFHAKCMRQINAS